MYKVIKYITDITGQMLNWQYICMFSAWHLCPNPTLLHSPGKVDDGTEISGGTSPAVWCHSICT